MIIQSYKYNLICTVKYIRIVLLSLLFQVQVFVRSRLEKRNKNPSFVVCIEVLDAAVVNISEWRFTPALTRYPDLMAHLFSA